STPSSWGATHIVAPVPGSAIAFDAATAALHRDGGYLDPTQSFTIAFWLKLTSFVGAGPWRTIYIAGDAENYTHPYIWIGTGSSSGPNNVVMFELFDGTNYLDISTAQPLAPNQWHYVVLTYNGGTDTATAYVDGGVVGSVAATLPAF